MADELICYHCPKKLNRKVDDFLILETINHGDLFVCQECCKKHKYLEKHVKYDG